MTISNLELADMVDKKMYELIAQEFVPERRYLTIVWNNTPYDEILDMVMKSHPDENEDITPIHAKRLVDEMAQVMLYRTKAKTVVYGLKTG